MPIQNDSDVSVGESERKPNWTNLPHPSERLSGLLLDWFRSNGRDFPWRHTTDAFHILSAELMLQRTRADQVVPVFEGYQSRFRSPTDVVSAGRDAVEAIFDGLGLYWRAEYFWRLQCELTEKREGEVPSDMSELLKLPGVGQYAATATTVFAFGARATVVDSNVLRVFGRWYGIDFPDHARRSPRVAVWASRHAPGPGEPAKRFNWALIDLGADVCTPLKPRCQTCPIVEECSYAGHVGP